MNPQTKPMPEIPAQGGHPRFLEILQEMQSLHTAKDADYSGGRPHGNFKDAAALGLPPSTGIILRATDKMSRIKSLVKNKGVGMVKDESLRDTLLDLANYCVSAIIELEEESQVNE